MKIRNGFVSNSSSSSFLVPFDKVPESLEELKNLMFPDKELNSIVKDDDEGVSVFSLVRDIYKYLKDPLTDKEILKAFECGTVRYYGIETSEENERKSLKENGFEESSIDNLLELYYFPLPSLENYFCVDEKLYKATILEKIKTKQKLEEVNKIRSLWNSKNILIKNKIKEYYDQVSKMHKVEKKLAKKDGKYFLEKNKGKVVFSFNFSDHTFDENYSPLESDDRYWGDLEHVCFSCH